MVWEINKMNGYRSIKILIPDSMVLIRLQGYQKYGKKNMAEHTFTTYGDFPNISDSRVMFSSLRVYSRIP